MRFTELFENTYHVYHGTDGQFSTFDNRMLGSANGTAPINMKGFNFTDNEEVARSFGGNLIRAEVTINNPMIIDAKGKGYSEFKHVLNDKLDKARKSKYDGVIIKNYGDAGKYGDDEIISNHFIPFNIVQIRVLR